jgi:predicted permease
VRDTSGRDTSGHRHEASGRGAKGDPPRAAPRDPIDDEIRHHLAEGEERLVAEGWEPGAARREAKRRFGNAARFRSELATVRRETGELYGPRLIEHLRSALFDVRYALRGLRHNPTFTASVVATLALGIGAATSIFAVVDAVLLRPMPYRDPDRLVEVNHAGWQTFGYTPGTTASRVEGWRQAGADFAEGWIAWSRGNLVRTDGSQPETLAIVAVTPGADALLGIPLLLGRAIAPDDARPGAPVVVVLGRAYYERLGGDPRLVGSTLRLESGLVTVVGVLRGGVRFPPWGDDTDLWLPLRDDFTVADRSLANLHGLWARLRPDVSLQAAQQRADLLAVSLQERDPLEDGWEVRLDPVGAHRAHPETTRALGMLSAMVAAIFLIAWVNGLNLLLVRSSARGRELGVRAAIGGSRLRILGQLLAEGLVLGILSGLAALALAVAVVAAIREMAPWTLAWSSPYVFQVEARALAFAFGASVVVGTVLGLVPGLHVLRGRGPALVAGRPADDAPDRRRLRSGLVVVQVALSMTLLASAGLLVNSFARLMRVDPGYDYERLALAYIPLSPTRYPEPAHRADFLRRLEEALEARPGIEAVTREEGRGFRAGVALQPEGRPIPGDQPFRIPSASIALDYLDVMGVELAAGRPFEPADVDTDAVLIDQDLARFLWGRQSAVGRRFRVGDDGEWWTVVGVVRELRLMGRDQRQWPHQILHLAPPDRAGNFVGVAVRTSGDPRATAPIILETLRELDPEQGISGRIRSGAEALADAEDIPRFLVSLMTLLALTALVLAAVGLYGVLAYSVSRRRRELGIRIALGADRKRVRRMVLAQGAGVAAAGVTLGMWGAHLAAGALEAFLYELEPRDPVTLSVAAALLLGVALAASLLPALRATRVDPAEVLRDE